MLDRGPAKPHPQALRPHRKFQVYPSGCLSSPRHSWPHGPRLHHRTTSPHRAIQSSPTNHRGGRASPTPNVPTTLCLRSHPTVDVGIHSSERVMSPASRVASHNSMAWLQTGVSSGNWPMFVTKSRKHRAHLEDPAGTEYLEDVALEQRGKVRGSRRSPRR